MKKVLFIDRDGTLIKEPEDFQIDSFEKLEFLPGAIVNLARIAAETDYELVMVSNQDGLGTASFPERDFFPVHNFVLQTLRNEGVEFDEVLIDRSFEFEQKPTRKPGTAMLQRYLYGKYDLKNSYVIGDRLTDIELANNLGCNSIYMGMEKAEATLVTQSWKVIYQYLKSRPRIAEVRRATAETDITLQLNLDGTGVHQIQTGLHFLDHMLAQVAKHAQIDLQLLVKGDLEVDEHHTIEDTALALGQAFSKALGGKFGIERYGYMLPMDDCLARVAIDFGGRPWLVWRVVFSREKIGDVPTEMFYHFFKSFCDQARCNLNIAAKGTNEHHKIESVFKAFAKAVCQAKTCNGGTSVPSTKGIL